MAHGRVGAFFDIDHTILEVNSGRLWLRHLWNTKKIGVGQAIQAMLWLTQYRMSLLDFEGMTEKVVKTYAGEPVGPIEREVEQFFEREVMASICTQARERVEYHRAEGHITAILSSATRYLSTPLARLLEIEHIVCTELEERDGILTGKHIRPACYGDGKVFHAERFAGEHDVDLDRSFFYTDSYTDLPMLERVGEPRVVNPDMRLKRKAASVGWGVETWTAPA